MLAMQAAGEVSRGRAVGKRDVWFANGKCIFLSRTRGIEGIYVEMIQLADSQSELRVAV